MSRTIRAPRGTQITCKKRQPIGKDKRNHQIVLTTPDCEIISSFVMRRALCLRASYTTKRSKMSGISDSDVNAHSALSLSL
jgi:hypothetical protein